MSNRLHRAAEKLGAFSLPGIPFSKSLTSFIRLYHGSTATGGSKICINYANEVEKYQQLTFKSICPRSG